MSINRTSSRWAAINHDLNPLAVLGWDRLQPFRDDTSDWPQWNAFDVSASDVIDYFQSMVILDASTTTCDRWFPSGR